MTWYCCRAKISYSKQTAHYRVLPRKYLNKKNPKCLNKVNRGRSDNKHVTECPLSCQPLEGTGAITLKSPAMLSFRKIIPALLTDVRSLLARLPWRTVGSCLFYFLLRYKYVLDIENKFKIFLKDFFFLLLFY